MRLHRLQVTAFGPFADTASLNFDALGEAGLFLLTGSTGAGKTSLLDAVCFALYGQVPGDRQQAGQLRSDAAAPGVAPRVELVLTVGGRRLRFIRSPAWQRPKARGCGTTLQQAKALAAERRGGGWETLATRIPDVNQLAVAVLGMDVHQFTQVVLLPQGRFQEFLRAGADARQAVLERLFATSQFRDVERWLVSHRQQTGRLEEQHRRGVDSMVDQIAAVAGVELPGTDAGPPADWAKRTASELAKQSASASARADEQHDRLRRVQEVGVETRRRADLRREGEAAQAAAEALAARQAAISDAEARLQSGDRARDVIALLEPLASAERRRTEVEGKVQVARIAMSAASVPAPDPTLRPRTQVEMLAERRCNAEAQVRALEAAQQEAVTFRRLTTEIKELARKQANVTAARDRLEHCQRELPSQIDELRKELAAARIHAAGAEGVDVRLRAARMVLASVREVPKITLVLAERRERRDVAVSAHNDARDALNNLRDRRLAGAAAWLAKQLVEGRPCPVCGGFEHPRPAVGTTQVPGEAEEKIARSAVAVAEATRSAVEAEYEQVQAALLLLTARTDGQDIAEATTAVRSLTTERRRVWQAAAAATELATRLTTAENQAKALRERLGASESDVASLAEQVAARRGQLAALHGRHDEITPADVDNGLARQTAIRVAVDQLISELRDLDAAQQAEATALRHAEHAAESAGFDGVDDVRAAAVSPAERSELHRVLEQHGGAQREVAATLNDPDVRAAMAAGAPDLLAAEDAVLHAEAEHGQALRDAGELASRARQVELLALTLAVTAAEWEPVRRAYEVAEAMATLAEGKSADNHLQMSLSAYVLSARLGQVVEAANERLGPMTSGRYALEHTLDRTAGERRRAGGGLGLRVSDTWTGQSRDPKTLSGGEMFQASLALALGLADVVTHESGGMQMHSLFVDEGFGSLDSDTLDDVMDVLDDLRSGGRVVGVVSHVDAMRERIPAQVQVVKGRNGSVVHQA